jgi:2-amino-4-hydroxy-6-hydroxymethyldihydropteridine diphosphokinase
MITYYLLTGSNIGNSAEHLHAARQSIGHKLGIVTNTSSIYKTAPWGNTNQQDFLNQVLEVQTEMTPEKVLETILQIEQDMGRTRLHKWEPRIIDIDILFASDLICKSSGLTIPHPLLHERRFTLEPMNEIATDFEHPVFKKTIHNLLISCEDKSEVKRI